MPRSFKLTNTVPRVQSFDLFAFIEDFSRRISIHIFENLSTTLYHPSLLKKLKIFDITCLLHKQLQIFNSFPFATPAHQDFRTEELKCVQSTKRLLDRLWKTKDHCASQKWRLRIEYTILKFVTLTTSERGEHLASYIERKSTQRSTSNGL